MMNHHKLPLPPKVRNSGSGDNFFDTLKKNSNLALGNGTYLGTICIHLKNDFSMIFIFYISICCSFLSTTFTNLESVLMGIY